MHVVMQRIDGRMHGPLIGGSSVSSIDREIHAESFHDPHRSSVRAASIVLWTSAGRHDHCSHTQLGVRPRPLLLGAYLSFFSGFTNPDVTELPH